MPESGKIEITVQLGKRSYPIRLGSGTLPELGPALQPLGFEKRIALISNPTVYALYGQTVLDSLTRAGFDVTLIKIPDGEEYKNLLWTEFIYGELLKARLERGSCLVALGGGVIGDITGFCAATYMRGIRFVQVPTTLLAQVDSSVGGKTGVNHPLGKNMIGAFWQPSLVWADTSVLNSLPAREFAAGMAEVIKYGVIRDKTFFEYLEKESGPIKKLAPGNLMHIIKRSCEIKAEVVGLDERESGLRAVLNYGHTIAHAVETLTNYKKYLHGEAVAIGMCAEAKIAVKRGLLAAADHERIKALAAAYDLPAGLPDGLISDQDLIQAMLMDKKVQSARIRAVLPVGIGEVRMETLSDSDFYKL
ncbi:MAG: 3-dehydroquinate synthase [Nitrospiraceae bacterium]|nr:3-dehydroquinate synthase [Nitrospiraceae bacterium]